MKTAPVLALLVVSLLLWAATAPSARTFGKTRLDDILEAILGVAPAQVGGGVVGGTAGTGTSPVLLKPGTLPTIPGKTPTTLPKTTFEWWNPGTWGGTIFDSLGGIQNG